jgi:hypothetical protein
VAQPLAALAGCVSAARARRPLGRRSVGEPVGEANVGPAHQALPPGNRDADVTAASACGRAASPPRRRSIVGDEQQQVDERRRDEQCHAQPRATEHVPHHAGEEDQPEGDLGADDECDQHRDR